MRKQRENTQMDAKKAEALAALSSARTLTEAAQLAGISRTTLWAYLKDKQFNDELQAFQTMRAWLRADQMEAARAEALEALRPSRYSARPSGPPMARSRPTSERRCAVQTRIYSATSGTNVRIGANLCFVYPLRLRTVLNYGRLYLGKKNATY